MAISFRIITYPFRDFYRRIKNVLRWLPTIWKDRDWDNCYITDILIKKLEFTRDFYLSDKPYSAEAGNIAKELQDAEFCSSDFHSPQQNKAELLK